MATTIKWPPAVDQSGRIGLIHGADASTVLVLQVLSDLSQNPFNTPTASMGDVTFKSQPMAKAMIETALRRLRPIIDVRSISENVDKDGNVTYEISFSDRESQQQRSVTYG